MAREFRPWAWLLTITLGFPAAVGAASPAGVATETVEFKGSGGTTRGFLARPRGDGPFPAIVVVHEWWGLSDWIKENTGRLAGLGYVALAVDLYRGKVTQDPGEAHELMRALDQEEAIADLKGGVAYLRTRGDVAKDRKLGVIGWCMGGGYSRLLSQASDAVGPTVICYGSVTTEPDQVSRLRGKPLLGIFGADDRGIPAAKAIEFGQLLGGKGADVDIRIFAGAGHGFMRPGGPQHNAKAADEAWQLITRFFTGHLGRS